MLELANRSSTAFKGVILYKAPVIWCLVLNSTLGMFLFGFILSVLNTIQDYLSVEVYSWGKADGRTRISVLNSILTVGAGIGAFVGGSAAQRFGRRKSMIIADLIAIFGMGLTLVANYPLFVIGRMITGFCCGLNSSIVPVYVGEMAPLPIKGTTGSCNQLLVCLGSLVAYLFGFGLPTSGPGEGFLWQNWWRIMLGFPIITCLLRTLLLTTVFSYETPKYLVVNGHEEEARASLSKIYVGDYATEQLIWLKREREEDHRSGTMSYKELFTKKYRMRFFIGCFVSLSQQMTGINALIFYSTTIFKDSSKGDTNLAVLFTTLFAVLNLVATLFSGQVLKRFGRKPILVVGDLGMSLCILVICILSLESVGASSFLPIPVFFYIIVFGLTYGPIVYVFSVEILPDIGVGIAILINWLGAFLVALFFPPLSERAGNEVAFGVFGVYSLLALLVIIFGVKETRGLSQAEINDLYDPPVEDPDDISDMQRILRRRSTRKLGADSNSGNRTEWAY